MKADVLAARRAGIAVYHHQQPEPVRDITGKIHDPLAKSHADSRTFNWYDRKVGSQMAPGGRVFISTRGGEFEPTYETYGTYGPTGRKKKDLTPDMLTDPATEEDVVSTFRHEVGHLQDKIRTQGKVGYQLSREIRAWQYAVEASPTHTVSERMVKNGLKSHAYNVFRAEQLVKDSLFSRVASWDRDDAIDRKIRQESKENSFDPDALKKADAFTEKVWGSLTRYGAVLRKKGVPARQPKAKAPWYPSRTILPGPGGRGQL